MNISKKVVTGILAGTLAVSVSLTAGAATASWQDASAKGGSGYSSFVSTWASVHSYQEYISVAPGGSNGSYNFAWYSKTSETPAVKISTSSDMSGAVAFGGTQSSGVSVNDFYTSTATTYYPSKVAVSGLKENTVYYYSAYQDGAWTSAAKLSTGSYSAFSFMWVGDPQIGSSKSQIPTSLYDITGKSVTAAAQSEDIAARNDTFNWNATLTDAVTRHPGFSFILSAGDQTENTSSSTNNYRDLEWTGFLYPSVLRSIPLATAIGNHDFSGAEVNRHYYTPNQNTSESSSANKNGAGYDYYFSYGSALFIVLDTNDLNIADHQSTIQKAVAAYPNAKWRIVSSHQDLYGSGADHSDSDGITLRTQLTPLFTQYKIDLVLNGHDHTYSRSKELTADGKAHNTYSGTDKKSDGTSVTHDAYLADNNCYTILQNKSGVENVAVDPQGTYYFSSDSATGSKYYELLTPEQDYVADRWQKWIPTYSIFSVTGDTLTVNTYETENDSKIDSTFTIIKGVDKSRLASLVSTVKGLAAGKYTAGSYAAVMKYLTPAEAVADQADAAQSDVNSAYAKLYNAYRHLGKAKVLAGSGDKAKLAMAISSALDYSKSDYTAKSYASLKKYVKAARAVYLKASAAPSDVTSAISRMNNAIKHLRKAKKSK